MLVQFTYDYMGRRVRKATYEWVPPESPPPGGEGLEMPGYWSYAPIEDLTFIYDGWNLVMEREGSGGQGDEKDHAKYAWGLDLAGLNGGGASGNDSSAIHGAGGIGGLLGMECDHIAGYAEPPKCLYFFDGNGNVGQLVAFDAGVAAPPPAVTPPAVELGVALSRYEYDPFGGTLVASDELGLENPFRFSTKYYDAQPSAAAAGERGLYYYGYRYYSPRLGRWMTRDPIGELGSENLFSFVSNGPMNLVDAFGEEPSTSQPGNLASCDKCCCCPVSIKVDHESTQNTSDNSVHGGAPWGVTFTVYYTVRYHVVGPGEKPGRCDAQWWERNDGDAVPDWPGYKPATWQNLTKILKNDPTYFKKLKYKPGQPQCPAYYTLEKTDSPHIPQLRAYGNRSLDVHFAFALKKSKGCKCPSYPNLVVFARFTAALNDAGQGDQGPTLTRYLHIDDKTAWPFKPKGFSQGDDPDRPLP